MLLFWIVSFSLLGSLGSVLGAGLLLAFPRLHERLRTPLLAYAVSTLLALAFLELLPHALADGPARPVLAVTLGGFVACFLLEKLLRLPHRHAHAHAHAGEPPEARPAGALILAGDAVHNFVDGVIVAAAFSSSVPLGILTALAVLVHELPQELGDFVILLQSGWAPERALAANALGALTTLPGALAGYLAGGWLAPHLPWLLALAAANFLYIAATDLAPLLHHETGLAAGLRQAAGLLLGLLTLLGLQRWLG